MCTMTLVPFASGAAIRRSSAGARLRIGFNRDESRMRAAGLPPEIRGCGLRRAIMPIDPVGGGTWLAVNDAGLAAALLNLYRVPVVGRIPPINARSRGEIVPTVMECATIEEAFDRVRTTLHEAPAYGPFSLIVTDGARLFECRSHSGSHEATPLDSIDQLRMFTSSGLGDALVYAPRMRLFEEMFAGASDLVMTQDAYHRHQWPDHPELSVCMARADACTVSYAVIELSDTVASLSYYPAPPNVPSEPTRLSLQLAAPA